MTMKAHQDQDILARTIETIKADGRRIEVVGSYENGKLQLYPRTVSELHSKHLDGKSPSWW